MYCSDPEFAVAHNNLGLALWARGEREEAISQYREALRIDPRAPAFHLNLANALSEMAELDEAIDHLQQAVQFDPKSAAARYSLGLALDDKGRRDEAISQFEEAIRLLRKGLPRPTSSSAPLCAPRAGWRIVSERGRGGTTQAPPAVNEAQKQMRHSGHGQSRLHVTGIHCPIGLR